MQLIQLRRESGKAMRRHRIVEAAAALLREGNFKTLSMEQIAVRAGVSRATLYNLFETKTAIFRVAFDQNFERYRQGVLEADVDGAVDRIFFALEFAASLNHQDPQYYRAVIQMIAFEPLGKEASDNHRAFWQDLVMRAVAAGELRPDTDVNFLGGLLMQIVRGLLFDWAADTINLGRLSNDGGYAFAMVLRNHVTKTSEAKILRLVQKFKASLSGTKKTRGASLSTGRTTRR